MEGGEAPEKVKKERKLQRKMMEDHGPRLPAPPPSLREAPYGASEVSAENRISVTEALRDRQDKISEATAAPIGAGEEQQEGQADKLQGGPAEELQEGPAEELQ